MFKVCNVQGAMYFRSQSFCGNSFSCCSVSKQSQVHARRKRQKDKAQKQRTCKKRAGSIATVGKVVVEGERRPAGIKAEEGKRPRLTRERKRRQEKVGEQIIFSICPQVCEEKERQKVDNMMAIHTESAPIFEGMNVNDAELKIQYIKFRPSQPHDSKSLITFTIPESTTPYMSLRNL